MASETALTPALRLKAWRKAEGLTQDDTAAMLGINRVVIAEIETGRRTPSLDWLHDVAVKLGIDPHWLDERLAPAKEDA